MYRKSNFVHFCFAHEKPFQKQVQRILKTRERDRQEDKAENTINLRGKREDKVSGPSSLQHTRSSRRFEIIDER